MLILAWRAGLRWSQFHLARFGQPWCGTPIPDAVQGFTQREMFVSDWAHVCTRCQEVALRAAQVPADELPAWRLSARTPTDGLVHEVTIVRAATREAALAAIRRGPWHSVLAFCPRDWHLDPILEPIAEPIPTLTGGNR